jgi:hypothetical protein
MGNTDQLVEHMWKIGEFLSQRKLLVEHMWKIWEFQPKFETQKNECTK